MSRRTAGCFALFAALEPLGHFRPVPARPGVVQAPVGAGALCFGRVAETYAAQQRLLSLARITTLGSPIACLKTALELMGVCSGFARAFDVDVTLVRVGSVLSLFVLGPLALLAYLVAGFVAPDA